jgi:hypothetical protein
MSKPTFQEWKNVNPGKGINEYFKEYPETAEPNQGQFIEPHNFGYHQRNVEKKATDPLLVITSVTIIIAFFLPWIEIRLLGMIDIVKSNGYNLPELLQTYGSRIPTFLIYAIPAGAIIALISELFGWTITKIAGQVMTIVWAIYWFFMLKQIVEASGNSLGIRMEPTRYFSIGIWITLLGTFYFTYDLLKVFFKTKTVHQY